MAATHPPVPKAVYVCNDVRPDPARQQINLSGLFSAVRVPADSQFPYTLPRMSVFAQMEDGAGEAELQVAVVSAATGQVVFHSAAHRVRFPSRLSVVSVSIRLTDCPFPAAGEYWVELHCDGEVVGDRVLYVLT